MRRARDTVLANISHEFRTPLAAQLASIELLREGLGTPTPAQREELVLSLERGTRRLTRLIDNLLESVRIEAGTARHPPAEHRSRRGHRRGRDHGRCAAAAALAAGRASISTDDLSLQGDAVRLTQVFVNLLANASKFAPEPRRSASARAREEDRIVASVEDAGAGLPPGAHECVFERFGRGGVEPAPGGMGLGLSISRSIVQRHGGSIAASPHRRGSTRFTI